MVTIDGTDDQFLFLVHHDIDVFPQVTYTHTHTHAHAQTPLHLDGFSSEIDFVDPNEQQRYLRKFIDELEKHNNTQRQQARTGNQASMETTAPQVPPLKNIMSTSLAVPVPPGTFEELTHDEDNPNKKKLKSTQTVGLSNMCVCM